MKIGVLGLGSIGKRHYENALKLGHKVDCYDPAVPRSLPRKDLILWADAIVIASPTPYHLDDLKDALHAGKHCLVEKPICCDVRQATELMYFLRAAKKKKLTVMVGNNLRFHEDIKMAKGMIDGGQFGNLVWANFTVAQKNEKPEYLRDGVTRNWGAHEVDLALYLLGPAKVAAASIDADDTIADILLTHDSGVRSTIHLDYHTHPEIRRTTVVGDKWLALDLTLSPRWDEHYLEEMQAFVSRVQGKETLGATGEEGLAALNILLEAKSHAKGR